MHCSYWWIVVCNVEHSLKIKFVSVCTSQSAAFEMHVQPGTTRTSFDESPALRKVDETPPKHVQFLEPISKTVVEDAQNPSYGLVVTPLMGCNFEWVCHLEDGSVNYIDGAKQPNYLVTADDVHLYLAIEVQPLDDRNRKGELVKVFANNNRNSQDRLPSRDAEQYREDSSYWSCFIQSFSCDWFPGYMGSSYVIY
ncbi:unnamed protein product [Arabidopsis lyrata]|nr:unnamed protein product [Arabidopsis lyrata]